MNRNLFFGTFNITDPFITSYCPVSPLCFFSSIPTNICSQKTGTIPMFNAMKEYLI